MHIRVGHITARCGQCGCEDFQPPGGEPTSAHELLCFDCGARVDRRALLAQIADETVKRAQAFLELSRKARSQPRKR